MPEELKSFDAGVKAQFPEMVKIEPCSSNECANGHKWPPQLAIQNCPGCGGQILLVRMIQCPVCNEDMKKTSYRQDFTNQGFGIASLCRGQKGQAESVRIECTHNAAKECMDNWNEK